MTSISSTTRITLVAVLLAIVALIAVAVDAPRTTEAVPVIGAGSCIDPDDCNDLAAGTVLGDNSCNSGGFKNACDSLNGTVGDNSCNDNRACDGAGRDGGSSSINGNSCNGINACGFAGRDCSSSIGHFSCNVAAACFNSGQFGGKSGIGDNSCNGFTNCIFAGRNGSSSIGHFSCNGDEACLEAGRDGSSSIGHFSCNGDEACFEAGSAGSSSIGHFSCNGDEACFRAGAFGSSSIIGDCENNLVYLPFCALQELVETADNSVLSSLTDKVALFISTNATGQACRELRTLDSYVTVLDRFRKISDRDARDLHEAVAVLSAELDCPRQPDLYSPSRGRSR